MNSEKTCKECRLRVTKKKLAGLTRCWGYARIRLANDLGVCTFFVPQEKS